MAVSKHENNDVNRKDVSMSEVKHNKNKIGKIIYFIGTGIVLLLLLFAGFISKKERSAQNESESETRKTELKQVIRRETELYLGRNRELLKEFESKIATVGNADFARARRNIPAVSSQFSSIAWNGKLCYKMAKDQLCDSSDTQAALDEVLNPQIIAPCERGSMMLRNELENFLLRLAESENQFHARLALCTGNSNYYEGRESARKQFLLDCHNLSEKLKADAVTRAAVIAGAGLEIVFLRTTISMAGTAFRHIVGRLVATGSTAAICAAADGPLPIGDIVGATVGIGSLAWCAYDLYQISEVLPGEIRAALSKMVNDYQINSRKQVLEFAEKTLEEYQTAAGQITEKL